MHWYYSYNLPKSQISKPHLINLVILHLQYLGFEQVNYNTCNPRDSTERQAKG